MEVSLKMKRLEAIKLNATAASWFNPADTNEAAVVLKRLVPVGLEG